MAKPTPQEELETLVGALIAQLHESGLLTGEAIEGIARRLHHAGMPDIAEDVRAIPLADGLSRPALELVIDGANSHS